MNRKNIARLSMRGPNVEWSDHLSTPLRKTQTRDVHNAVRIDTAGNGKSK